MAEDESMLWIKTEPDPDGNTFRVTVTAGEDYAIILTPDELVHYGLTLLRACAYAAYDAAVGRQLTRTLKLSMTDAGLLIRDLRADRPPLPATPVFHFEPGINSALKPFLHVYLATKPTSETEAFQLDIPDARHHAMGALEAGAYGELDTLYLRLLMNSVGAAEPAARRAVNDLTNHMDDERAGSTG